MIETPHLALPFRIVGKAAVVNEQDSADDIAACVEAVLRYPRGSRPEAPQFGRPEVEFTKGDIDLERLASEIRSDEPRADYLLNQERNLFDQAVQHVGVAVESEA